MYDDTSDYYVWFVWKIDDLKMMLNAEREMKSHLSSAPPEASQGEV